MTVPATAAEGLHVELVAAIAAYDASNFIEASVKVSQAVSAGLVRAVERENPDPWNEAWRTATERDLLHAAGYFADGNYAGKIICESVANSLVPLFT